MTFDPREYDRRYQLEHQDELREYKKRYLEEHRDELTAYRRQYYQEHRDSAIRYATLHRQENPEQYREYRRKYDAEHPEVKLVRNHNYRARQRSADGSFTVAEIRELADKQDNKCYYCGKMLYNGTLKRDQHIEHKVPLIRGGTNDISNIVLSCQKCNNKKYDRTHEEFNSGVPTLK